MSRGIVVIAAGALAACLCVSTAVAQTQGGPAGGSSDPGGSVGPGGQFGRTISAEEFNKLQDYADTARRMTADDKAKGRTLADLLAEDKAAATAIAAAMPLACDVKEAVLATEGEMPLDGKTVKVKTYEAACTNGMGYFLISPAQGKASGVTCFGADALKLADIAAGRTPGAVCTLPPNTDLNAMSTATMTGAGRACTVKDHRYIGRNAVTFTEYDEVVCDDDTGYMMAIALPGSNAPVRVSTCRESTLNGVPCKLSGTGQPLVTLQTFKDALAQHNFACTAGNNDIHAFGQENIQKRYVVEFRCSQRPASIVAFIPLNGNKAPFEISDCAGAAKRGIVCKLNKPK